MYSKDILKTTIKKELSKIKAQTIHTSKGFTP